MFCCSKKLLKSISDLSIWCHDHLLTYALVRYVVFSCVLLYFQMKLVKHYTSTFKKKSVYASSVLVKWANFLVTTKYFQFSISILCISFATTSLSTFFLIVLFCLGLLQIAKRSTAKFKNNFKPSSAPLKCTAG